jgi:hypothetical protein
MTRKFPLKSIHVFTILIAIGLICIALSGLIRVLPYILPLPWEDKLIIVGLGSLFVAFAVGISTTDKW